MRKRELEARIIALEARCAALEQSLAFWRAQPIPAAPLSPWVVGPLTTGSPPPDPVGTIRWQDLGNDPHRASDFIA